MENGKCINIFLHNSKEELTKAFTDLWVQVINECERNQPKINLQTENSKI